MPELVAGLELAQARRRLAQAFRAAGLDTPQLDARLLLQHATGLSHAALIAEERRLLTAAEAECLRELARRRLHLREPVSRIIGKRAFFGRDFLVTPHVLDPRPDTEALVEATLKLRRQIEAHHEGTGSRAGQGVAWPIICDLGTGSGAIIVSLLAEWPAARGLAVDISPAALRVTRHNARAHGVAHRLLCVRGNWLDAIGGPLDIVVSNPPYITEREMRALPPEVRHDPTLALAGGTDGLVPHRAIARRAADVLRPGGWLLAEVGTRRQAEAALALFAETAGLEPVESILPAVLPDLAGRPRAVTLRKPLAA